MHNDFLWATGIFNFETAQPKNLAEDVSKENHKRLKHLVSYYLRSYRDTFWNSFFTWLSWKHKESLLNQREDQILRIASVRSLICNILICVSNFIPPEAFDGSIDILSIFWLRIFKYEYICKFQLFKSDLLPQRPTNNIFIVLLSKCQLVRFKWTPCSKFFYSQSFCSRWCIWPASLR